MIISNPLLQYTALILGFYRIDIQVVRIMSFNHLKNNDHIVSISQELRNVANDLYNINNKSSIITNGVSENKFYLSEDEIKKIKNNAIKKYNGKKIILYLGNILKNKGVYELLEAIKYIVDNYRQDIVLLLVGKNFLGNAV